MGILTKIKDKIKSVLTILVYATGISILIYSIWFAVKNRSNGNSFFINMIIGALEVVFNSSKHIIEKWLGYRGIDK